MSGKTGKRATGKKPVSTRRQSAKTDGAFGKEGLNRVQTAAAGRNIDKPGRKPAAG
jgi:hypothetical protein